MLRQSEDFVGAAGPLDGYIRAVGRAGQPGSSVDEQNQPAGALHPGIFVQHDVFELVAGYCG